MGIRLNMFSNAKNGSANLQFQYGVLEAYWEFTLQSLARKRRYISVGGGIDW
jgi:hypothetical protein